MIKLIFWSVSLFVVFYSVYGQEIVNDTHFYKKNDQLCFSMSWLGSTHDENTKVNCSDLKYKGIPCIKPVEISKTLPNLTDLWLNENKTDIYCVLQEGYSCIKYTYIFNNKVANISYFCGKMIDGFDAINDGCYTQKIRGHVIEACACRSVGNSNIMPCNSSTQTSHSVLGIILIILICLLKKTCLNEK